MTSKSSFLIPSCVPKRVISAQGPFQLMAVLSVLFYQREALEYTKSQDFLILDGYGVGNNVQFNRRMIEVCLQIAEIWKFESILTLNRVQSFYNRTQDFQGSCDFLKKELNLASVEAIYTCRNWQFFNEVLLGAYPDARSICYGDGLGNVNLYMKTKNIKDYHQFPERPFNPCGFLEMKEAYLTVPVYYDGLYNQSLSSINITIINPVFFETVVKTATSHIQGLSKFFENIRQVLGNHMTLILTSTHTESYGSNIISQPNLSKKKLIKQVLKNEIDSYMDVILNHTSKGESILIKGHPRERFSQSAIVAQYLRQHHRKVVVVPEEFIRVPIEFLFYGLIFDNTIGFNSYSCVSISLLFRKSLVIGFDKENLKKYYMVDNKIEEEQKIIRHSWLLFFLSNQAYIGKFELFQMSKLDNLTKIQDYRLPLKLQPFQ